jgi:hypothetical protein
MVHSESRSFLGRMPALQQRLANGTFNDGRQNGTAFGSQPIVRSGRIDGDYECSTAIAFELNGKGLCASACMYVGRGRIVQR